MPTQPVPPAFEVARAAAPGRPLRPSPLDRKLLRDAIRLGPQLGAVALVMACGVAVLVMAWSMLDSLARTQRDYYAEARFADVFLQLERAPDVVGRGLRTIPGVADVETRVVADVTLDLSRDAAGRHLETGAVPAVGRLISLPDRATAAEGGGLNRLHLLRGRLPDPARRDEAVVGAGFAAAHRLAPGDRVYAVLNGRLTRLDLVGVATSPEYVYTIGPGGLFPDDRSFGVFWMDRRGLAAAFDMEDAFNDVLVTLAADASPRDVCRELDRRLDRYGGRGGYGREYQSSHRYLTNELRELRNMGRVAPLVFLAVTAILMHLVVSRLVGTQREQIATLTAFGHPPGSIGRHYAKLALVVLAVGGMLGVALGWWLGVELTAMYGRFFRFPLLTFRLDAAAIGWSLAVAATAALAGVAQGVSRAVRIHPAAAMQPEPPARYRLSVVERFGLAPLLSPAARMMLRHLERRPLVTGLSVLGLALGAAVMVLGMFVGDAVSDLGDFQFTEVQRFDRTVTLVEPAGPGAIAALARLPGVWRVEPFRAVTATLRFGPRERRQEIMALAEQGELLRLVDRRGTVHDVRREGLVVSTKLADLLGARPGDALEVEVLEGRRPRVTLPIVATIDDMVGTAAYLHIDALRGLLGESGTVSGAFLAIDTARSGLLDRALADTPQVSGVVARDVQLRTFRETIAATLLRMRTVNALFAAVIACGVVATTARQSVIERSRDLASLRVLGYTRREVAAILLGEQAILTLAAVPPGLLLGAGFVVVTTWGYDTELFRVPARVHPRTYAIAAGTLLLAAAAAAVLVRRQLDRLDLVAVLKARD
jgi:putative ABC transport system permease protein